MAVNQPPSPGPSQEEVSRDQKTGMSIPQTRDTASTLNVLRALCEGDEKEQRETWEFLRKAMDEDRPSDRKLFQ